MNEEIARQLKKDLDNWRNGMGFGQWIYCHTGYEIDGVVIDKGDMRKNWSTRPVMNTDNWRPATKEEIEEYYSKHYN